MSLQSVQNIIGKAAIDRAYRELLFSKPEEAVQGYELNPQELASVKALSREKFDAVVGELEEQILAQSAGGATTQGAQLNAEQMDQVRRIDLSRFGMYANTN